jgi:hypothetical protein
VHNIIVYTCTNASYYYALMRAGYTLHLLECLKCGIVGKCCSNVPRSLIFYAFVVAVVMKAIHTCMCEKNVRSSGCAISEYEVIYTYTYPNFSA